MSIISDVSDDSPCGVCHEPVVVNDQALECDMCSTWFHLNCNDASPESYDLFIKCEGLIPWFCTSCKGSLRSSVSTIKQLKEENEVMRQQLVEITSVISKVLLRQSETKTKPGEPFSAPSELEITVEPVQATQTATGPGLRHYS